MVGLQPLIYCSIGKALEFGEQQVHIMLMLSFLPEFYATLVPVFTQQHFRFSESALQGAVAGPAGSVKCSRKKGRKRSSSCFSMQMFSSNLCYDVKSALVAFSHLLLSQVTLVKCSPELYHVFFIVLAVRIFEGLPPPSPVIPDHPASSQVLDMLHVMLSLKQCHLMGLQSVPSLLQCECNFQLPPSHDLAGPKCAISLLRQYWARKTYESMVGVCVCVCDVMFYSQCGILDLIFLLLHLFYLC